MSIPTQITTLDHLDVLPIGALLIDGRGDLHRKVAYDGDSCTEWLALDQSVRGQTYIVETSWQMQRRLPAQLIHVDDQAEATAAA